MSFPFSPVTKVLHLDDVDVSGVADGDTLVFDEATETYVVGTPGVSATAVKNAGRWEVWVDDASPPQALLTPDGTDWVYVWVEG